MLKNILTYKTKLKIEILRFSLVYFNKNQRQLVNEQRLMSP